MGQKTKIQKSSFINKLLKKQEMSHTSCYQVTFITRTLTKGCMFYLGRLGIKGLFIHSFSLQNFSDSSWGEWTACLCVNGYSRRTTSRKRFTTGLTMQTQTHKQGSTKYWNNHYKIWIVQIRMYSIWPQRCQILMQNVSGKIGVSGQPVLARVCTAYNVKKTVC